MAKAAILGSLVPSFVHSMSFDFDQVPDRNRTDSRKWRRYEGRDILPLWVADMDCPAPPAVLEALRRRVDHGIFGYGVALPEMNAGVVDYTQRRYGWKIDPEWIVWLPGLVCGLNVAASAFGSPGDAVLCCTPVYPPFLKAPVFQQRALVTAPLRRRDGRYEFDLAAMERAVTPRMRAFFLCNPHNPVGRVFTRAELEPVAAFCARHDLVIVSDEIHCDLILDDLDHVPVATLSQDAAARTVTLMAPSKTYNIPGLGCSYAIISDAALRVRFMPPYGGIVPDVNILGHVAGDAAYRHGEGWRQALLAHLRGNRDFLEDFVARELPGVTMPHVEATYLAWLNIGSLQLKDAPAFFEQHGLGLSDGTPFGVAPDTHVRLNFGCSRALLEEACRRLRSAVAAR